MLDLRQHFGRAHCISLDDRGDRWTSFVQRLGQAGVVGVEKFRAIDGRKCPPPPWFRAGAGAWGALRSHTRIIEDALQDGLESVMIFEDDVIFRPEFAAEVENLLDGLKETEWSMLYFGGSHLETNAGKPHYHASRLLRSFNVNRLHAYAVHRRFFKDYLTQALHVPLYLAKTTAAKTSGEREFGPHLDHMLGYLHEQKEHLILAASPWLCGQAAGLSNIVDVNLTECYWDP